MHLGNGAITPECAIIAWGAAGAGLACCGRAVQRGGIKREALTLALGLGCVTFAAQAINLPVAAGFSGHLVGGVILAWLLGPALGTLTMSAVLLLQVLILGDGGLTSLGANIINMAVLPGLLVTLIERRAHSPASRFYVSALSGMAVVLAAVLIVGESALFRGWEDLAGWSDFALRMFLAHAWLGCLEALAALGILHMAETIGQRAAAARPAIIGLLGVLLLAASWLPISSNLPDGYEAAAQASGMTRLLK